MNALASTEALRRDLAAIETELIDLDRRDAQLQSALEDVAHDTRRCNDTLERSGWHSVESEARGAMLLERRRAIVDDQERNRIRCAQLIERSSTIRQRLNESEDND